MIKIIGVRFRNAGKIYYFDPKKLPIKKGDHVIVETARGIEYGSVVADAREVTDDQVVQPLKPVIRIANADDNARAQRNKEKEKEAFRIVGISQPMHKEVEKNFEIVPQMWGKAAADGTIPKLAAMMDRQPMGLLGVSACNDREEWKYFIAVSSSLPATEDLEEYEVPASTWAIFSGSGTNLSIQELEQRIVTEWLPTSGYEYAAKPDIEV